MLFILFGNNWKHGRNTRTSIYFKSLLYDITNSTTSQQAVLQKSKRNTKELLQIN